MKRQNDQSEPEMPSEIEFSGGVRGKYAPHTEQITRSVMLAPDVAEAFPDAESVNTALRAVANAARRRAESGTP